jgi:16S rRNA (cytosine967-C5)-methyltransferase
MKALVVKNSNNARHIALKVCLQVIQKGQSLTHQLEQHLPGLSSERDKGFCSELSYGLCRYYFVLSAQLKKLLKRSLKPKDRDIELILLLGLYQIRFMRVSDHAAVNESVKLLHAVNKNWAKGLVNAILRSYIREFSTENEKDSDQLTGQEHVIAYPDWIRKKIQQDWPDLSTIVLRAGNQQAPMVLRVNLGQITRADYLQHLIEDGIGASVHPLVEQAIILHHAIAVDSLYGFASGIVSVQDAAAQIAATLLGCEPGMRVLDACAAPGGKSLHIMQTSNELELTALDKDATRLSRVAENLGRANLVARLEHADAAEPDSWFDGQLFDRILLDAPCSASGIIRRHPDIRLLRKAQDVDALVKQQETLLNALWPLLSPGGRLVYSTCSIFKDENEFQVAKFIKAQSNCVELAINPVQWGEKRPAGRQILPGFNDMDGFYYACLDKTA